MKLRQRSMASGTVDCGICPDAATLEKMKREWETAADSIPQLICVLDGQGNVIRANRTLERWKLGSVADARGLSLHRLLHGNCADPECGLSVFWRGAFEQLLEGRRVKQECWDPRLRRHLSILLQPPVYQPRVETHNQPLAIATVEDISEIHAQEEQRVGDALRETRRELQRLSLQHVNIRENERRRMAMDLHDGLGQSLNLLKLSLQETARLIEQQKCKNSAQALYGLAHSVEAIVVEVRRIAMDLRPSTLDDLGLIPTLSWFFREFQARCPRPKVVRRIEISEADVPEPMKLAIYRLLQEATCNALRHASADVIEVRLHKDADGLHFSVADDGCGFDKTATSGLGLQSMRERAELLGGVYAVCSKPGNGTRVSVTWPLAAQQSAGAPDESLVGRVRVVLDSVDPANALRSSL